MRAQYHVAMDSIMSRYTRRHVDVCRHEAREAEPKDTNINKARRRDMFRSTYNRIGNVTDGVTAAVYGRL